MKVKFSAAIISLIILFAFSSNALACNQPPNQPPVASAQATRPGNVFKGEPVYFDGSFSYDPDGSIAEYYWTFGDGSNPQTGIRVTHSFSPNINYNYTVTLRVTDNRGATNTVQIVIHVYQLDSNPIYVDKNAPWTETPTNIGTSWSTAYKELRGAISAAGNAQQIYVAEGTYTPTDTTNRAISFQLKPCMKIYGGYSPSKGITEFAQRDPVAYPTILSGHISDTLNSYTIMSGNDSVTIDGFIFEQANGSGTYYYGGGIYLYAFGNVDISKCVFRNNNSPIGGGIEADRSRVKISNCVFSNNSAGTRGGGLSVTAYSNEEVIVEVINCVFNGNASYSGAGIFCQRTDLAVTNCTLFNNTAQYVGGGLCNTFEAPYDNTTITNSIFWGNTDASGQGSSAQINLSTSSYTTVTYSCIQGGWSGTGNIGNGPLFANSSDPDGADNTYCTIDDGLRLQKDSPCVDVADNTVNVPEDIIGIARADAPDKGTTSIYDMGAYELTVPSPNPMEWAVVPHPTSSTSISMTAATANDPVGGIKYFFDEITGNGQDSLDWQSSPIFENTGLTPNTKCTYRVKVRNAQGQESYYSTELSAKTWAGDGEGPQGVTKPVSGEMGNDLSLQVDPFTGSANYSVPIAVLPARQGSEPLITLKYSSGGGNGWCGVGWFLSIGAIQRNMRHGVPVKRNGASYSNEYDDDKGFSVSLGAVNTRLVYIETNATTGSKVYRAETDQAFLRYEFYRDSGYGSIPANTWVVTDKSGNKFYFGVVVDDLNPVVNVGARMDHPQFSSIGGKNNTFLWALAKIIDISGNATFFDYTTDAGQIYLHKIRYNGNINSPQIQATHTVEFELEDRGDKSVSYATGYRIETNKRLKDIRVKADSSAVRRYHLSYQTSPSTLRSLLSSVTLYGSDDVTALPPVAFEYQQKPFEFEAPIDWGPLNSQGEISVCWNSANYLCFLQSGETVTRILLLDVNGDGLPDRVQRKDWNLTGGNKDSPPYHHNLWEVQLNTGSGFTTDCGDWGPLFEFGDEPGTEKDYFIPNIDLRWLTFPSGIISYCIPSGKSINKGYYADLIDLNADGFPDYLFRWGTSDTDGDNFFVVGFGTGKGFERTGPGPGAGSDFLCYPWGPIDAQNWRPPNRAYCGSLSCDCHNYNVWHSSMGEDSLAGYTANHIIMLDIDGDGLPDRVMRRTNGPDQIHHPDSFEPSNGCNVYRVQLNTGGGFERTGAGPGGGVDFTTVEWGPLDAQAQENTGTSDAAKAWNCPQAGYNGGIVRLVDLNGDGLPDRVMRYNSGDSATRKQGFKVQFNTGYGFERNSSGGFVTYVWGPLDSQGQTDVAWDSITASASDATFVDLFDINGDGLPDRVMRNKNSPYSAFKVELNTGTGFTHEIDGQDIQWLGVSGQGVTDQGWNSIGYSIKTAYFDTHQGVTMCDINGDGLPDRIMRERTTGQGGNPNAYDVLKVQLNKGPFPDLLKKVTGKLGGSAEVTYKPSTQYDNKDDKGINRLPFPVYTASSVTINDGFGNTSTMNYNYSRGMFDPATRRGFGKVEVTDPLGTKTVMYFHQGGGYNDVNNGEYNDVNSVAKKGMPYCVDVYGNDGKLYSRTVNKVEETEVVANTGWYFAYVSQTIKLDYAGINFDPTQRNYTADYRATIRQSEYDLQTGNIKKTIDLGEVRLGENATDIANNIKNHTYTSNITANDDLYIHTEYVDPTAQGADFSNTDIINKIKRTWTTSDYAGVNKLKEIVFTYDTHGRVHTEKTWIDKNKDGPVNSYTAVSEFDYDAYSNLNYTKGKAGIETTTNYDTNYRMFPVKKTTGTFVTESTFDVNSGLPLTTKDAMSIKLQNVYDVFYRLTDVYVGTEPEAEPSLWITHIEYNHGGIVSGLSQNYIHQKFNGYEAYIYNDGLGRVIQSRVNALDTETANDYRVTDTKYNARGNVEFTTTPFFSNGSAFTPWVSSRPGVLTEYDCLGRAWKTTPSDDDGDDSPLGPSTVEYKDGTNPWAKVVTDPEGKVTKSYFDSAGRVINLIEVIDPGDDIQTTYEYDRLGRLITITDNSNNEFTAEYDSLGRKIRSLDPDMGEWTYAYDDSDRLTEQEDAKGNVVKLYYNDELGRLSKKEVYDSSPQLVNTITFTYDSSGGDPDYTVYKGLAYKVEDSQGWIKASYDTRGRAVKTTRHIAENNKSYTTYSSYDDAGRVRQINYPNDEAVIVYNYGNGGELREVRSIQGTDGEVVFYQPTTFDEAGKLLGIDYGNGVKTRYEYYTNTKRLMNIHTYKDDPVTGTQLQDLTYTFDKVSNITRLVDNLYTGTPSSGLGTAENKIQYDDLHRLTSLYSVAEDRTITYGYDALGNITSNEELPSGQQSYGYLENGCTKPHAVTSAAGKTYDYDTCGNMTTRGNQTLVYDARNRLIRVYDGSGLDVSYGYAYDGTRLWKKDNGTGEITQLWIGDIYEEKNGKVLCHVYAGSQLVATFEPLSYWARIINDTPVLAQLADFTGGLYIILLGEGRAPFSIVGMSVLVGLGFGLFYSRKRLLVVYGIPCYGRTDAVYKRNPYRQIIIFTVMATVFLSTIPNEAFATATYDPVFYYYHSDHLGSSQIMTDSSGELVQHYAYKPYGNERWKDNDAAFSVTNRYTSQQIDEDTGLYYYGARYYDPQIGRFIQPDSIIPDASSQGLNRYAYCYNNPLIFTDPSGNDAFSFVGDFFSNVGDFVGGAISWGFSAITDFWEAAYATLSNAWGVIGAGWGAGQVNAVGANIGSAASWAPVPAETGGDPMIGARAAGSTRGIAACCNIIPLPFVFPDIGGQNFTALVYSALIGAFAGGVTAEMFGGSFAQGAVYGAAAGYVLTECLIQMERGSVYTGNPPPIPDMDFERLAAFAEAWLVGGREPTQAEIYNFRNIFPCLGSDFWVTHETTGYPRQNPNSYNCIAFSLGYSENNPRWVNPLPTYQAMDKLYRSYGFTVSDESRANVALYGFYYWKEEMLMGVPEHAAVRIGGGWYESKLGADIQIIHRLGALEGPLYGFVGARFYEKK